MNSRMLNQDGDIVVCFITKEINDAGMIKEKRIEMGTVQSIQATVSNPVHIMGNSFPARGLGANPGIGIDLEATSIRHEEWSYGQERS